MTKTPLPTTRRSITLAILAAGLLLCSPSTHAGPPPTGGAPGVGAAGAFPNGQGPPPRVERRMLERARQSPNDEVDVIITYRQRPRSSESDQVRDAGGRIRREFNFFPGHAARVPAHALEPLARNPNVYWISEDAPVGTAMDMVRKVASHPQGAPQLAGIRGAGVTVAVLDSGYASHPATAVLASVDIVGGSDPVDGNGHGSHIAGIINGSGSASGGSYQGIAPDASLVSVKVLDADGRGYASDVIAGIDWVIQNKETYGIRVANLSLGTPVTQPAAVDPLVIAVEQAWNAGIVVVCSAGNNGLSGYGTITSPGNSPKVITVGSLTDWNDRDPLTHRVSSYSSRGPTVGDHFMKPDLLAPGNRVISTRAPGSGLDLDYPGRRKSAGNSDHVQHFELSGTSMAAAVVSGAAALMLGAEMSQVLVEGGRSDETVLVQADSRITYLANMSDPGVATYWRYPGFDDSAWAVGRYGIGYEKGTASQSLHRTLVPHNTRSVFTRATFTIDDVSQVDDLFFGADFDDAVVAWINGNEIYRSANVDSGDPGWSASLSGGHESSNAASPDYGNLSDVSAAALPHLVAGENVLAVAVYNRSSTSSDLVLVPRLVMNRLPAMRYLANASDPGLGLQWTLESFDDSLWSDGSYGVGYDTSNNALSLLQTEVASGTRSVYTRAEFTLGDLAGVQSLLLGLDYDDGAVAWINGYEVYRTPSMPAGTPAWNAYPGSHESSNDSVPDYGNLVDITNNAMPALHEGTNVLAIAVYNRSSGSSDLVLAPQLTVARSRPGISPDTVKARLMRSAKKVFAGDPFTVGAGVLDISAAILEQGTALTALSPAAYRDEISGKLGFDDTADLWGGEKWSLDNLWSEGMVWSDAFIWSDAFVWSDGFIWSEDLMWSDAFVWSDSFIWSDAFVWSDAFIWTDGFIWSDSALWDQGPVWSNGFIWSESFIWTDSLPQDD